MWNKEKQDADFPRQEESTMWTKRTIGALKKKKKKDGENAHK